MKIYVGERQSGKTTLLIKESAKTQATIVVANYPMVKSIRLQAETMGLKIPPPITVTNYIYLLANGGLGKTRKYLVDELQMVLSTMNIQVATVDCDCIHGFLHGVGNGRNVRDYTEVALHVFKGEEKC